MNIRNNFCLLCIGYIFFVSCNNPPSKSHGPIKLGDPNTIVTEKDSGRLQDMVNDLRPNIPTTKPVKDTAKPVVNAAPTDTAKKTVIPTPTAVVAVPVGPGLKAEFKETTFFIPNLAAKLSGSPNLARANGAVYTFTSGNMMGNTIHVTGTITKVSQRYQSVVILKAKGGNLPLESLSETTPWKPMTGSNGAYPIVGIAESDLAVPDADAGDIKDAVKKSCRSRRLATKKMQEFLASVATVKAANQKPLTVILRSVMWKIDGKDADGKIFSKQIRIDVPL